MPWRPLNNVVIVKPDPIEKLDSVIIAPDKNTVEKISPYGTVVSWGNKCHYKFKVGQRVLFHSVNSPEHCKPMYLEVEGEKYRIMKEDYIHAILE